MDVQVYSVDLNLGPLAGSLQDVRVGLGNHLETLEPRLDRRGPDVTLALSVPALDLWLALLKAMAAVTNTGHPVHRISAHLADGGEE